MEQNPFQSPLHPSGMPVYGNEATTRAMRHSGLGITSFVMAILIGVFEFVMVLVAGLVEVSTPGGMDENSPTAMVIGFGVCGGMLLSAVAVVLGIVSLFQAQRKKLFGILGIALSCALFLGVILLMIIGTLAE
ncbi:MAG TPA: hypothetical protein VFI31_02550 [Pirellulales bacterium]|nr:hypothetical protein [Pirellulales bacterium]